MSRRPEARDSIDRRLPRLARRIAARLALLGASLLLAAGCDRGCGSEAGRDEAGLLNALTTSPHAQRLRVAIDPPAALDREQVAAEIARREASIVLCRGVGGRRPLAAGSIRLQLALDQAGQVRAARVLRSDLERPDVELCLTLRLRLWRLPAPRNPQGALVEFSLDWRPDDSGGLPPGMQ